MARIHHLQRLLSLSKRSDELLQNFSMLSSGLWNSSGTVTATLSNKVERQPIVVEFSTLNFVIARISESCTIESMQSSCTICTWTLSTISATSSGYISTYYNAIIN